ncbi:DUF3021 domain-containing protein [Lacticaseibacillus sharpeae]|uniref:DUF3021 domain-containing protein n=1 Tax=Lacticaseibacillus sharpeae JCM 1186 = DSM 20505 TaxID=1291052 RepID=A0A0R1ZIP9_9LACO|nr:DUF3021 domain-containing protein [Lacticaseibacillus sharpeae]KRM54309.1 hypothetical protein FC18_GL000528 [Lacticaseibacillus sharpeae JCM 1186 = DSM 20505]
MQMIKNMLQGVLVGCAIYVVSLACHWQLFTLSPQRALELILTSAVIGAFSWLLQTDRLSFVQSMVSHMLATLLCLVGANFVFGWDWLSSFAWLNFGLPFIIIYLLVWLAWWLQAQITVRQINAKLRQH